MLIRKKTIRKYFHIFFPYVLIILIASLVRFIYWQYAPGLIISDDTYSYYQVGQRMLKESLFVDHYRAPFYSLFLVSVVNLLGAPNAPLLSGSFIEKINYVIPFQMGIGILGLIILYHCLMLLKIKRIISLLFVLFIGTDIIIFSWERLLLTESFAVFIIILNFYMTIKIIQKPRFIFFILLFLLSVCSVMLRPFNVGLPVIPLLVAVFYHRKIKVVIYCAIVLLFYTGLLHLYSSANYARWGYYGISRASDINMLGKILDYRLDISAGKEEKFIYDLVADYQSQKRDPHPFRFLEHYNLIGEENIPSLIPLRKFGYQVIGANLPVYMKKSSVQLPNALLDVSDKLVILPSNANPVSRLFNIGLSFNRFTQTFFFLIVIFGWIPVIQFVKKPTVFNAVYTLAVLISFYQIIFSVFIGHGEYGRLILPSQPLMYFLFLYPLAEILKPGRKRFEK